MLKSALEDFESSILSVVPGSLAKLHYVAMLHGGHGVYSHWGLFQIGAASTFCSGAEPNAWQSSKRIAISTACPMTPPPATSSIARRRPPSGVWRSSGFQTRWLRSVFVKNYEEKPLTPSGRDSIGSLSSGRQEFDTPDS